MARVIGVDAFIKRLELRKGPELISRVGAALLAAADEIKADAQISLSTNSAGGSSGGKHQHVPSAPGTPPHSFTGNLANNIESALVEPLKAEVSSNAPYAAIQEYGGTLRHPGGTHYFIGEDGLAVFVKKEVGEARNLPVTKPHTITLPERPYMRPAVEKNRGNVAEKVRDAVSSLD